MEPVTINRDDLQPGKWCEQCGATPTTITVIRWAAPTRIRPARLPQQSHYYCAGHAEIAERMWMQLRQEKSPNAFR
jgi:hypothetical protein